MAIEVDGQGVVDVGAGPRQAVLRGDVIALAEACCGRTPTRRLMADGDDELAVAVLAACSFTR